MVHYRGAPLSGAERLRRIKALRHCIVEGLATKDFANLAGMQLIAACVWLRRNFPEERAKLQAKRRHGPKPGRVARGLIRM